MGSNALNLAGAVKTATVELAAGTTSGVLVSGNALLNRTYLVGYYFWLTQEATLGTAGKITFKISNIAGTTGFATQSVWIPAAAAAGLGGWNSPYVSLPYPGALKETANTASGNQLTFSISAALATGIAGCTIAFIQAM